MVEVVEQEAGVFKTFPAAGIGDVPMYLLSFDKDGKCLSPRTRERVLAEVQSGVFSDIHVYSHGWNNVFTEAVAHYTEFFSEYFALRAEAGVDNGAYRPLIVGILWPSTAFLAAGESTPSFAAGAPAPAPPDVVQHELAAVLAPAAAARVAELARGTAPLAPAASAELARLLLPLLAGDERPGGMPATAWNSVGVDDVLRGWGEPPPVPGYEPGQPAPLREDAGTPGAPRPAGLLGFLNPREILRKATVFMMKDRAGVVGRRGVGPLVRDILDAGGAARVHLTGHSYGARVMLSALASLPGERKVASVLLLQPAVNAWCFAEHIGGPGGPDGAYRAALAHVAQPLYTTFSERDVALRRFFELALRRPGEQGDLLSAGPMGEYAALGVVGPLGMPAGECLAVPMAGWPQRYPRPAPAVRVVALNGSKQGIASHGDVRNPFTEWAMVNLVGAAA